MTSATASAASLPLLGSETAHYREKAGVAAKRANLLQSLRLFGAAVGIEQPGIHPISTIFERLRGTGFDENTSKEHEQNALPDILMTMSQIPDVNRELAEVGAMFAVFERLRGKR